MLQENTPQIVKSGQSMKNIIKIHTGVLILFSLFCISALPNVALSSGDISQEKLTEKLTTSFRRDGWSDVSFKVSEASTVLVHHAGLLKNSRLTDGELLAHWGRF
jgi:hypothetical protein